MVILPSFWGLNLLILTIPSHSTTILPSLKQGNLNESGSLVHLYPGCKQRKMKICNILVTER